MFGTPNDSEEGDTIPEPNGLALVGVGKFLKAAGFVGPWY
jgi:hypothetical protein